MADMDEERRTAYHKWNRLFLVGYMGSGKTTIGKQVAGRLNLPFYDLDQEVEKAEGRTIAQIFEENGEEHFRTLERKYLSGLIHIPTPCVVAMGGGTPCFNHMHQLLIRNGYVVYLKLSPEVLLESIIHSDSNRPLVQGLTGDELRRFITNHVREREFYYNHCDLTVDPRSEHVVNEIAEAFLAYQKRMLAPKAES